MQILSAAVARSGLGRLSVANARLALGEIGRAVEERRILKEALEHPASPGELGVLSREECVRLLSTRTVGRFVYVARIGVPDVVPVTYVLHGDEVLFCSGTGPKLQAAQRRDRIAFEVDEFDETQRSGWSVVVHGRAEPVAFGRAAQGPLPVPWAAGPRGHVVRIVPTRITGRRLY
jgi:hypothetical protein